MTVDVATVAARVEAQAVGFEDMQRAIMRTLNDLTKSIRDSLNQIPAAVGAAVAQGNRQVEQSSRQSADQVGRIRQQLADREAQQTMTSVAFRIRQVEREGERIHALIEQQVTDRQEAGRLMMQNGEQVSREIVRIREEEASRVAAISERQVAEQRRADEQRTRDAERARNEQRTLATRAALAVTAGATGAAMLLGRDVGESKGVAREFDANMRDVNSIAKMTEEQLRKVSGEILNLGRAIPKTAADMSAGLYDLESSGFGVLKGGMEVLDKATKAATAGKATTGQAVQVLAGTLNAYGLGAEQAGRVTDVLFKTIEAGVVNFPQMAQGLGNVTATANLAGINIENVGASIALMTAKNIPAAQSFTALNGLMLKMITPSESATRAAKAMGIEWFNVAQAGEHVKKVGFAKAIEEIAKATGGDAGKMKLLLEDIEAFKAASILAANGGRDFAASLREVNDAAGSTEAAFNEQMKSFENQEKLFKNAQDRVRIGMGAGMYMVINPLMDIVASLADAFSRLPAPIQAAAGALEAIGLGGALVIAGLGAAGSALAGLVSLGPALIALKAAVLSAIPAVVSFGTSVWMAIAPLLPIIGAIALVVAALAAAWHLNLGGIRDFTEQAMKVIGDNFAEVAQAVAYWWGETSTGLAEVWQVIVRLFQVSLAILDELLRGAFGIFIEILDLACKAMVGDWEGFWSVMYRNADKAVNGLGDVIGKGFRAITSFLGETVSDVGELFGAMWEGISNPSNAQGALAVMDAALARIQKRFVDTAYNAGLAFENFQAKGAGILDSAGRVPAAAKVPGVPDVSKPGTEGGGRLLTEQAVKKDIEAIMLRLKAHKISTDEAIKQLEAYKAEHKLAGDAATQVDAKVAELRDRLAKQGAAGAKREAAAVAAEKRKELKDNHDRVVAAFNDIERRQKEHHETTAALRLAAYAQEKRELQALLVGASKEDQERLKNRIAAIDGAMGQIRQAQVDAQQRITNELDAIRESGEGDSLGKSLAANKKRFEDLRKLAVKNSLEMRDIDAQEIKEEGRIRSQAAEEMKTFLDSQAEETLERKLAAVAKQFANERKKQIEAGKLSETTALALTVAEEAAKERVRAEYRLKTFQGWQKATTDILGVLDVFADQTRTMWAKVQAIATVGIGLFSQQLADVVVPVALSAFGAITAAATGAITAIQVAIASGGVPALAALIAGWVGAGLAAVQAGIAAGAAWLQALGPIGWAIAAVVALTAAVVALWAVFNSPPEKVSDKVLAEVAKIDAGLLKNREAKIKAEEKLALKALEDELQERRKNGANSLEIDALRVAGQAEIFAKSNNDLAQLDRDREDARLDALAAGFEAEGNMQQARNVRMAKEDLQLQRDRQDRIASGLMTEQEATRFYLAQLQALIKKHYADEATEREAGMQRQVELMEQGEQLLLNAVRAGLDQQLALGQISVEDHATRMAKVAEQEDKGALARLAILKQGYEAELALAVEGSQEQLELRKKVNETTAKMQAGATRALETQLEAYRDAVNAKYQEIAEGIDKARKALEMQRDSEQKGHRERLADLEAEAKAVQRQIDLIDEQIAATKRKYDGERKQANASDKIDFEAAVGAIELTPDLMTYDAIEAQRQSAENRFALEEITQEQFLRLSTEAALRKAALAKKELADEKVPFEERTRIQGYLVEGYKAFQKARLDAIDLAEERENKERLEELERHETELARITSRQKAEQAAVDAIDERYRTHFNALATQLSDNQTAWDAANQAIKDGTDKNVQAMIGYWSKVHASINQAIGLARFLSSFGFGNFGMSLPAIPAPHYAASGGLLAGGTPGKDSIPVMAMPGELIVSNPLTLGLQRMVASFDSLMRAGDAGGRLAMAGAGGGGLSVAINIHDPVVREDADLDRLATLAASKASELIGRQLT